MTAKHPTDLGTLQTVLVNARRAHASNAKALTKAQDAASRSKKALDAAQAALEDGARSVIQNG